jgi:hypothetical protein
MRSQDHQTITLFGGECIPQGCKGRRSDPEISSKTNRRAAAIVCALLVGFTTAATAITMHRHTGAVDPISLPGNLTASLEPALY